MAEREQAELERLVADVVRAVLAEAQAAPSGSAPTASTPSQAPAFRDPAARQGESAAPERLFSTNPAPRTSPLPGVARLAREAALEALTRASPARLGVGRAGLRYPTDIYLQLRGDHAVAKDAVVSEPTPEFLATLGAVELRSQAADLQTFLLHPDLGRVLDDASLQKLRAEGTRGADVQVILADGLSAWAAERNAGLLPALQRELAAAGFSVGRPIWVHRARIAVADQIGVELGAKATLICLGERPGLGTGDSLSIYLAWNPAMGQDNAEKNCISNVRPAGFSVDEAARQAVVLLKKARELGRGGLALGAADAPGSKP